ncbi:MAG: TRAP transporter substrate-binding protein DctP [Pseudomonadota bacterium]|nr:TRAP transporter substrate-binding protein DctP [Pseudomonadota bacterium]
MAVAEQIELKAALPTPPGTSRNVIADLFADEVARRSEGDITVKVFPSGQLYDDTGVPQALASGSLDMAFPNLAHLSRFEPNADILSLPMMIGTDADVVYALFDGEIGEDILARLETKLRSKALSGVFAPGPAVDYTRDKHITKFSDLEGLNLRVPGSPVMQAVAKAMGLIPVAMSSNDMIISLAQGRLDGLVTTVQGGNSLKLWEAGVKYMWMDGSDWTAYLPLISNTVWDELSEEQQTLITEAWAAVLPEAREVMAQDLAVSREALEANGVTISSPTAEDIEAKRASLLEEQPAIVEEAGMDADLIDRALTALDDIRVGAE